MAQVMNDPREMTAQTIPQASPLAVPERRLLGPGPSNVSSRVMQALGYPVIGHMDPAFLGILHDLSAQIRGLFGTTNELTIALSGTGTSGMEAGLVNVIEPGDRVVVASAGYFADRIIEIATRCGAAVVPVRAPWGEAVPVEEINKAIAVAPTKLVAVVQGETSTGVLTPIAPIGALCRSRDTLLMVDAVASLGGVEMRVDDWNVDICYTGSQKCLSAPPGLALITVNTRVRTIIAARKHPVSSFYLDLEALWKYWSAPQIYHHTPPLNLYYALREALQVLAEEGLEASWARHAHNAQALYAGLTALGLEMVVQPERRLSTLTTVRAPEGIDEARVRSTLLQRDNIEIAAGLGAFRGKAWRVGLMGYSSQRRHVAVLMGALAAALADQGLIVDTAAAIQAVWSA